MRPRGLRDLRTIRRSPSGSGSPSGSAPIAPTGASGASTAPARQAAAKDWTTLEPLNRAQQQVCKVSVEEGTAGRIYNRVDARRMARARVAATLTATRRGEVTARTWQSGWVRHGNVSDVGTFKIPKAGGWALIMSIYGDDAGSGGELSAADIGRC